MTVRELIEALKECDQESPVYLSDWVYGDALPLLLSKGGIELYPDGVYIGSTPRVADD